MRLLSKQDDPATLKVRAVAEFAGLKLEVVPTALSCSKATPNFVPTLPPCVLESAPWGLSPVFGSNAICRLLSRLRPETFLYGETLGESALVDMWLEFCLLQLEVPFSTAKCNTSGCSAAREQVGAALVHLEEHLACRTYIVGERVTVADVSIAAVLLAIVSASKCPKLRESLDSYINLKRWLDTLLSRKEFKNVAPNGLPPVEATGACSNTAKQTQEQSKEEAIAGGEVCQPKSKCALDLLPPSKLNLDEFKRQYSNAKDLRGVAMPWLWEHIDDGYCFYRMKYEKLDGECLVAFVTSNQLGGFLQRLDNNFRKYAFGVIDVVEDGSRFDIVGVWMFRGSDIPQLMREHPSFEYHTWTKLEATQNQEHRKLVEDYFCNCEDVEGRKIADSKVYK